MPAKTRLSRMMVLGLLLALGACLRMPPVPDMRAAIRSPSLTGAAPRSVTLPFILDAGRMLVEITLLKPGGGERKVLAFVNMGSGAFGLSHALFRELNPGNGRPLRLKFGSLQIALDGRTIQPLALASGLHLTLNPFAGAPSAADMAKEKEPNTDFFAPHKVEAVISPGLLQHFQVVFDYGARTMTLAAPGTLTPEGVAVPMRVNPRTGFATVDATLDGKRTPLVIDNGGSFSTLRDGALVGRALQHAGAVRGQGRVLTCVGGTRQCRFDRKAHLEVGNGDGLAGKPAVGLQVRFDERQRRGDVRVDELGLHVGTQGLGDGSHEEGHRLCGNGHEHQLHHQPVHQRPFGMVHPEAALAVFSAAAFGLEPGQFALRALSVGVDQVFQDRARFGNRLASIRDDGRLAQRVHGLQGRGCEPGLGVPRVHLQFVGQAQFLKQPEDTLRTRGFEVVNGDHDGPGCCALEAISWGVMSAGWIIGSCCLWPLAGQARGEPFSTTARPTRSHPLVQGIDHNGVQLTPCGAGPRRLPAHPSAAAVGEAGHNGLDGVECGRAVAPQACRVCVHGAT